MSILVNVSTQGLYHDDYSNAGVMFASIPNFFAEFYAENDVNNNGLECMRVLNEIIADFDDLLEKYRFNCSKCWAKCINFLSFVECCSKQ